MTTARATGTAPAATVNALLTEAFGPPGDGPEMRSLTDVNRDRGVFSTVWRAELTWPVEDAHHLDRDRPSSVVAKLPVAGPNGEAARSSGAYRREALAYRDLLHGVDVARPFCHLVAGDEDASFLLEDLSGGRHVDQLDGLTPGDAGVVVDELAALHRHWSGHQRLGDLPVRRNTVAGLAPDALAAGIEHLRSAWADRVSARHRRVFADLIEARQGLVDRYVQASEPTLCHGDPRADNLVFDADGRAVLFDWQQMAIQFGEADLAWLAATSLTPDDRRLAEKDLVARYEGDFDRYRLGFALPGMAVLLLAQRELGTERLARFVEVSLKRIATALDDLDVAALGY